MPKEYKFKVTSGCLTGLPQYIKTPKEYKITLGLRDKWCKAPGRYLADLSCTSVNFWSITLHLYMSGTSGARLLVGTWQTCLRPRSSSPFTTRPSQCYSVLYTPFWTGKDLLRGNYSIFILNIHNEPLSVLFLSVYTQDETGKDLKRGNRSFFILTFHNKAPVIASPFCTLYTVLDSRQA
jgi:hypothetical protein